MHTNTTALIYTTKDTIWTPAKHWWFTLLIPIAIKYIISINYIYLLFIYLFWDIFYILQYVLPYSYFAWDFDFYFYEEKVCSNSTILEVLILFSLWPPPHSISPDSRTQTNVYLSSCQTVKRRRSSLSWSTLPVVVLLDSIRCCTNLSSWRFIITLHYITIHLAANRKRIMYKIHHCWLLHHSTEPVHAPLTLSLFFPIVLLSTVPTHLL